MKWTLILLAYTVTGADVPHEVRNFFVEFESEALCTAAREKAENELKTRVITVKATCVQTKE